MSLEEEEKRNRRVGMIVSVSIHAMVVLLFAFLMAWRAPNPPLPEYGIELNFGLDEAGTGDLQPQTPVIESESQEEAAPEEETTVPENTEESSEDVIEEVSEENIDQPEVFEDQKSPDVAETKVEEQKETLKQEEEVEETQKPSELEKTTEEKPPVETDKPGAQGVEGENQEAQEVNQGDKTNETGDQGKEEGKLDERALYGKPGGGGGSSLEMAGWIWDFKPQPNDTSDESGRVVFEIKIDDQGEIISIRTIEKTVSPSVEQIYKAEVEKLTFSKTDNLPPAPQSVGRITFIIKSN